jgi:protocatechuate 3,4-dioxygenase beta subunit
MKRRSVVQSGLAVAGLSLAHAGTHATDQPLTRTPSDYEGPFYPVGDRSNDGNDLLANMETARGAILHFKGQIVDTTGNPLQAAYMDIWQTDPDSRYNHPGDRNPGDRYDDFAYWGKARTDANGHFAFRTYVPGAYRPRPAHIHYKVWVETSVILTSQVYFKQLGGTEGASKFKHLSALQVADLVPVKKGEFETKIRIVV